MSIFVHRIFGDDHDCDKCWEIVSNSNCDLESQLGFLIEDGKINLGFLVVEGKTILWCGRKSIPY